MWKSFVLELHGEWSKFAVEYDHSATPDDLMAPTNWPFELARTRHLRTVRNRSGTHKALGSGANECVGLLATVEIVNRGIASHSFPLGE